MKYSLVRLLIVASFLVPACGDDSETSNNSSLNNENSLMEDVGVADATNSTNNNAPDMGADPDAGDEDTTPTLPPEPWSVFEAGPYNVGYQRIFEVTYDAVGEPGRTFTYVMWYPTFDEPNPDDPAKYIGHLKQETIVNDATVAIDEPAPVLIFSHGNSSLAEQSFYMTEFFASHGWIVVALNHTGNTFTDTNGAIDLTSGAYRPQDIKALLDHLYDDLPADDPLAGLYSDQIVLSGHSFGGYTTLASAGSGFEVDAALQECEANPNDFCDIFDVEGIEDLFRNGTLDDRIDVAIPHTPGGYFIFQDGLADITMPTLVMTGGMDATLPNDEEGDPIWEAMVGPHMRLDLTRGGHFTYSNMCELLGSLVPDDGCGSAFIDSATAHEAINAYSLAFARYHLFQDESNMNLLTGVDLPWGADEVKLSWKAESPLAP